MEIQLNNQPKIIPPGASLQQLLDEVLGAQQKGIAVAINNTVVPKAGWTACELRPNDSILIIRATQGG